MVTALYVRYLRRYLRPSDSLNDEVLISKSSPRPSLPTLARAIESAGHTVSYLNCNLHLPVSYFTGHCLI